MKLYTEVLIILLVLIALPDIFFYRKLKDANAKPIYIVLHLIFPVFFTLAFLYIKFMSESSTNFRMVVWIMWLYYGFLLLYIPKLIHVVFYLINNSLQRYFKRSFFYINIIRVAFTSFVVIAMIIGAYVTPRHFEVKRLTIPIKNLAPSFNGYKIVQISDIHLGSWNNKYKLLQPMFDSIAKERTDLIVFSGDMVNNFSDELNGWQCHFKSITSKDGNFAVLGNHDYGDYTNWHNMEQRDSNRNRIVEGIGDLGFTVLKNNHIILRRGVDSLAVVGVENWGKSERFRYSNLTMALSGLDTSVRKILLAHDPNQWAAEVQGKSDIVLTLSGHTHAGQLGFRIGSHIFSPAAFVFKHWVGLYRYMDQYLYVNKGIGYIGLPMHVGIKPEITVLTLKGY